MAFCANCGSEVQGSFCGKCGMAMGATVPPPSPAMSGGSGAGSAGLTANVAGALAYLLGPITGILFLVIEPYNKNPNVRFHAWQSIALCVAWIVFWIVMTVVLGFLSVFALILTPILLLLPLLGFALWLYLMWKAYQGEQWRLPLVGDFAAKQAGM
jgi:uncharacterized membrane protein